MYEQILIAGFGGQGVLKLGRFLALAGMAEDYHVTWAPSYGAAMRGGTANCTVTIADEEINTPLTDYPRQAIVLNQPSMDKFEPAIVPGGLMMVNTSMINREPARQDIKIYEMPVNKIAEEMGLDLEANMLLLGAYIRKSGLVAIETALLTISETFYNKGPRVIENNRAAFRAGMEYADHCWI